jgi:hypothetical protein
MKYDVAHAELDLHAGTGNSSDESCRPSTFATNRCDCDVGFRLRDCFWSDDVLPMLDASWWSAGHAAAGYRSKNPRRSGARTLTAECALCNGSCAIEPD